MPQTVWIHSLLNMRPTGRLQQAMRILCLGTQACLLSKFKEGLYFCLSQSWFLANHCCQESSPASFSQGSSHVYKEIIQGFQESTLETAPLLQVGTPWEELPGSKSQSSILGTIVLIIPLHLNVLWHPAFPLPGAVQCREGWMPNWQHLDHDRSLHVWLYVFSSLSLRAQTWLLISSSLPYPFGFYTINVHRLAVSNTSHLKWQIRVEELRVSLTAEESRAVDMWPIVWMLEIIVMLAGVYFTHRPCCLQLWSGLRKGGRSFKTWW